MMVLSKKDAWRVLGVLSDYALDVSHASLLTDDKQKREVFNAKLCDVLDVSQLFIKNLCKPKNKRAKKTKDN